jgi:spermidine synthase
LLAVFMLSGGAGLVLEVVLQHELARVFGVSALATATVLAAYMGGLALGAWVLGRLADRARAPVRLYALLEAGIAAYALAVPRVVGGLTHLFAWLCHGMSAASPTVGVARFGLAVLATLPPTFLMGGTLPTLSRALQLARPSSEERGVAGLYTANTAGAALGAAACSYALLPGLGLSGALTVGAGLNLLAGVLAWTLLSSPAAPAIPAASGEGEPARAARWVLALAAWSGLATFAYEVAWTELLALVVGSTAYAFGLMLAVLLAGLALGAAWAWSQPDSQVSVTTLGLIQVLVCVFVAISLPIWAGVPVAFVKVAPWATTFAARELARALAATTLLLPPAALLGAFFPVLLREASRRGDAGSAVGGVLAVNTLGAIAGSLLTGFAVLPALGARGVLVALSLGGGAVAAACFAGRRRLQIAALACAGLPWVMPRWDLQLLSSGANIYFVLPGYMRGTLAWSAESLEGGWTTVLA